MRYRDVNLLIEGEPVSFLENNYFKSKERKRLYNVVVAVHRLLDRIVTPRVGCRYLPHIPGINEFSTKSHQVFCVRFCPDFLLLPFELLRLFVTFQKFPLCLIFNI